MVAKLCGNEAAAIARMLPFEDFVKQSYIIHGENRYIYDESCWRGSIKTKPRLHVLFAISFFYKLEQIIFLAKDVYNAPIKQNSYIFPIL